MSTFTLWCLFHRPGTSGNSGRTSALAIIAFATATAVFLTVLGGVHGFIWRASADHTVGCYFNDAACAPGAQSVDYWREGGAPDTWAELMDVNAQGYVGLAFIACVLLVVPFAALAGSAARLAASRRDARLAALRLAGATRSQVTRLVALDAAGQALVGALIGMLGYFAAMPAIMLLRFQNRRFTFEQLWVGPLALVLTVIGVTLLALVSALLTLRRVSITPLGVISRAAQPLPSHWRAAIFAGSIVVAVALFDSLAQVSSFFGEIGTIALVLGFIMLPFALMNLVGTWAVSARAKSLARRPHCAADMIAMRRILDNPKRAWRNVSGIALAVFIAGVTAVAGCIGGASGVSGGAGDDPTAIYARDMSSGGLLTLMFAAILAAVSSGVMQAGSVYDQAQEYRMLLLEGADVDTLNKARFREVMTPLNTVVAIGGGCAMVLMVSLFASAMTEAGTLLTFFGGIALCYALVSIGTFAANCVAARLNRTG